MIAEGRVSAPRHNKNNRTPNMEHEDIGFTIIRGTFSCKFCDKAIALLEERGVSFSVQKLKMSDLIARQAAHNHPTVPIILHGARLIGGFSQLEAYLM